MALVKIRSSLKCRIHSILEREGITTPGYSDLFEKKGLIWLKSLSLPFFLSKALKGYLNLIERMTSLIEETEKSIKLTIKENPLAQLLLTIPEIGFFTAYLILCEVVDITRFPTLKKAFFLHRDSPFYPSIRHLLLYREDNQTREQILKMGIN